MALNKSNKKRKKLLAEAKMKKFDKNKNEQEMAKLMDIVSSYATRKIGKISVVRFATQSDLDIMQKISQQSWKDWSYSYWLENVLDDDTSIGFVLAAGKSGIGYTIGQDEDSEQTGQEIEDAFYGAFSAVIPKYRRIGFYTILTSLRDIAASKAGYKSMLIHTEDIPETIAAHESVGYSKIKLVDDYYFSESAWLMGKDLTKDFIDGRRKLINSLEVDD